MNRTDTIYPKNLLIRIKKYFSNYSTWELLFLILDLLIVAYMGYYSIDKIKVDDAYITYRYAENIADGKGFVYNLNNHILSTSTPLYAIILGFFSLFFENTSLTSHIIGITALIFTCILIFLIFKEQNKSIVGLISIFFISIDPFIYLTYGMETLFYISLIVVSFFFYLTKKYNLTAIALALSCITRLDGFILAVIILGHYFLEKRKIPVKPILLFLIFYTPWFLFSIIYFGSPIPQTFFAKISQANLGWVSFWFYLTHQFLDRYIMFLPFFLFGLLHILRKNKSLMPILAWEIAYISLFSLFGLPKYFWYYVPLLPFLMIFSSLGIFEIAKKLQNFNNLSSFAFKSNIYILIMVLLSIFLATQIIELEGYDFEKNQNRINFYVQVGEWINENSPENSSLATFEIGLLGYYSKRTIVDLIGLLQPDITANMAKNNKLYPILEYEPDYILYSPAFSGILPLSSLYSETIQNKYVIIKEFEIPGQYWMLFEKTAENERTESYNFIGHINEAKYKNIGTDNIPVDIISINTTKKPAFSENPLSEKTASITFGPIQISNSSILSFSYSIDPRVFLEKGDGVIFEIILYNELTNKKIFSEYIDPKNNESHRKWHDNVINLNNYSNEQVNISFITMSGPNNDSSYDSAWWGNPVLIID